MNSKDVDERIRAALTAAAGQINENDLRPAHPPIQDLPPAWRQARWLAPMLAAAAVVAVVAGTTAIISSQSTSHQAPPAHSVSPGPNTSTHPTPTSPKPTDTTSAAAPPAGSSTVPPKPSSPNAVVNCAFADLGCGAPDGTVFYEPLWPFASYTQAKQWETVDGPGGHQPWHADSGATALAFVNGYLGFADINRVTSSVTDDQGAHVGVGYRAPNGTMHTAAVLHLVRYTPTVGNTKAGWEVVGSDDTDFSLEQPAYNSRVSSPMTVGGHITGVDENIVVAVRTLSGGVESLPGLPAGGTNSPWSETVPFSLKGVLTIVASTGGHLTQHERFAIQGVHT